MTPAEALLWAAKATAIIILVAALVVFIGAAMIGTVEALAGKWQTVEVEDEAPYTAFGAGGGEEE